MLRLSALGFLISTVAVAGAAPPQDDYTITTVMKLVQPYDVRAMNDEFQSAKLLRQEGGVGTFQITYRPFHRQVVTANPNWRIDDAKMTEFLKPRLCANWDAALKEQILRDLRADGIDVSKLDDKTVVEKVSRWALNRSAFNSQFGLWMVEFQNGHPYIPAKLDSAFKREEPKGMSRQAIFDRELFGKGMYLNRTHGACTSSSTYMATILRAVGIPTRIILTIPSCDGNDPKQVETLTKAVRHHKTSRAITKASGPGFSNHVFNEVWVGKKWVRLNYDRLGQPIVDADYEGLMTHVYTALDVSEVPFAKTWGARYSGMIAPKLSSVNPYQLVSARDDLRPGARFDNPAVPELNHCTIIAVLKPGDPAIPSWARMSHDTVALFRTREWVKGEDYHQLRQFLAKSSWRFKLSAPGEADVVVRLTDDKYNDGPGNFVAFGVRLEGSLKPGVQYRIVPLNSGHPNTWSVASGVVWKG